MTIHHLAHRARRSNQRGSITGLFWLLSPEQQAERIRHLARQRFSLETIGSLTRKSVREVTAIIEGAA